jgi:hypothetical protein
MNPRKMTLEVVRRLAMMASQPSVACPRER